jgi:hypothetical protein
MEEIKNNTTEQDKEYEVAKAEAEADKSNVAYIHFFRKPFEWEGKEYKSLTFDFDKHHGRNQK